MLCAVCKRSETYSNSINAHFAKLDLDTMDVTRLNLIKSHLLLSWEVYFVSGGLQTTGLEVISCSSNVRLVYHHE